MCLVNVFVLLVGVWAEEGWEAIGIEEKQKKKNHRFKRLSRSSYKTSAHDETVCEREREREKGKDEFISKTELLLLLGKKNKLIIRRGRISERNWSSFSRERMCSTFMTGLVLHR